MNGCKHGIPSTVPLIRWAIALVVVGLLIGNREQAVLVTRAQAPEQAWSDPVLLSTAYAWFPDVAVDALGNVHVVWTSSEGRGKASFDLVVHTMWDGEAWSEPNDIVAGRPRGWATRPILAPDRAGNLLITYRRPAVVYFKRAPGPEAASAQSWSVPRRISGLGEAYYSAIALDSTGTLHVVWSQERVEEVMLGEFTTYSDIFYRYSDDGGVTWSHLRDLSNSTMQCQKPQIVVGPQGILHVVWSEMMPAAFTPTEDDFVSYVSSPDGGQSWSSVTRFSRPEGSHQIAVALAGGNGEAVDRVVVVWGAVGERDIYYQTSTDNGASWSAPALVPGIFSRLVGEARWDAYDMATDSAGHVHLVAVGRLSRDRGALVGLYHLEWDGESWSSPQLIFGSADYPEWPRITLSGGNQLHVVWFVRDYEHLHDPAKGDYKVWYSTRQLSAPSVTPAPTPTASPTATPTPEPAPTFTPTAYPTLALETSSLPDDLRTESDEVLLLLVALSPIILLVGAMAVFRRHGWRR